MASRLVVVERGFRPMRGVDMSIVQVAAKLGNDDRFVGGDLP